MTTPITIARRDGTSATLSTDVIESFRARLRGPLLFPDDPRFEAATRLWNGMIAKKPALAVQPTGTADVVATVDFARELELSLSARCGGHNIAGTAIAQGGLTIDMSRLRGVIVNAKAKTATVQGGCLLGDVDRETQLYGLATPLGFISETGVAGLTLGGGLGYLTRRFGYSVDNLLEVDIVTADGRVRRVSRDEHDDLFWAVRGAGANMGVVTRFEYQLHDVGPTIYGGLIGWPFERADDVLAAYQRVTADAPRELSIFLLLLRAPPAPFVPERWRGQLICSLSVCYSGDLRHAEEAVRPLRAVGRPVFDLLAERPYTQLQSYLDDTEPKGNHYYWKTEFVDELSDDLLSTIRDLSAECPIPGAEIGILQIGGALNDRASDDGAIGNRGARFAVGATGMWEPNEPNASAFRQWIRNAWQRFRPFSTGGNYINFQTADEGEERIRATYGDNFERVLAVKQKYDPDNLFRSNRNIRHDDDEAITSAAPPRARRGPRLGA